jgi:aryl-alcohol dehydrogenase-like predicted oxidoreductase
MDYRLLGRTGLRVSELCFGAMAFGDVADETSSHELLDRFAGAGGTFIDTSNNYSRGVSEQILGRWLARQKRANFVIATKVRGRSLARLISAVRLARMSITARLPDPTAFTPPNMRPRRDRR